LTGSVYAWNESKKNIQGYVYKENLTFDRSHICLEGKENISRVVCTAKISLLTVNKNVWNKKQTARNSKSDFGSYISMMNFYRIHVQIDRIPKN